MKRENLLIVLIVLVLALSVYIAYDLYTFKRLNAAQHKGLGEGVVFVHNKTVPRIANLEGWAKKKGLEVRLDKNGELIKEEGLPQDGPAKPKPKP
ncbi:MAG: hypothetical protein PHH26_00715 [Candidatus Thermoplasmatota archaeon]|nr:hypothetical protein [Candidatus Thermoplasmatota archaeon]